VRRADEGRSAVEEPPDGVEVVLDSGWLNPAGAVDEELEERTLTNLYNEPPAWLRQLHERLDAAVLEAYGFESSIEDQDLLAALLELNLARAGDEQA